MLPPGQTTLACATSQGSRVSPRRAGLEARDMMHAAYTRAMPSDTLHTEAWQAAALPCPAPQRGPSGRGTASGAAGCHSSVAADGVTLSHKEDAHGRG
jgi:hypothetical protein